MLQFLRNAPIRVLATIAGVFFFGSFALVQWGIGPLLGLSREVGGVLIALLQLVSIPLVFGPRMAAATGSARKAWLIGIISAGIAALIYVYVVLVMVPSAQREVLELEQHRTR